MLANLEQWIQSWASSHGWPIEAAIRLGLAALCGGLIGAEREVRGRQAGFRTFLLVCLGAAMAMVVSVSFAERDWDPNPGVNVTVDPARIAYGVMAGIGFLGGGVIVHAKGQVRGLTTAAGLWCVAAIGLSAGFGFYSISVFCTLLVVVALWILDYVEELLPKTKYRTVTLRVAYQPGCIEKVVRRFKQAGLHVVDASFERCKDNLAQADIGLRIAFTNDKQYYRFEREIEHDGKDLELIATREL